jgi:Flp pilus assembly protein TadG
MATQISSGLNNTKPSPRHAVKSIARFARAREGASAVEFALIAAPFTALLVAILQTAVVLLAQQVLQTATEQSARLIMTGQAQTSGLTANQFRQEVCSRATAMFNCSGIRVMVQTFSSFSSVSMTNPVVNGQIAPTQLPYAPGGDGDIVVVQSFYQWPVVMAPLGFNLSNMSGNTLLMVGTSAFRNEPF